jgi:uncharacterized protein (TIGR02231 family)
MRKILLLAFVCLTGSAMAWAAEKHTASIGRVTVFTNGAQVERSKSVNLVQGEQVVTFTGMSPYMDTQSMQVKALGRLTVLGVSHRTAYPDSAEHVRRLKQANEQMKAVEHRIQQAKDEQEMLAAQLELVKTNCSVAGRTVATPLANIKELNNYYAQEVLAVKKRSQELDDQLIQLKEELQQKKHSRDSIANRSLKTVTEIDVKVDARQAGRADFNITYYVRTAGWYPSYDVRSSNTNEPLQLSYKANIFQNTKEDWKNVPVTLSSANPNRSNVAPELGTYWLDFEREFEITSYRVRERAVNAMKMKSVDEALQGRVAGLDIAAVEERPEMEELMESDVVETARQQAQFGYEFEIKAPLTIPNGGKSSATTIELSRHELSAQYEYRGFPKMDKEAFLMADATDWQRLNLLEGEANVYFDNSFVGKSMLDPTVNSDTLHFSLGRDSGIRLKRTKVSESSTRRFFGSNQEQTMTWRITVKNARQEAVSITVFDQTPVARNTDINISVEELSGGSRDDKTGIVKWPLQLQPGEQRELLLQYKVKYPKNQRLHVE